MSFHFSFSVIIKFSSNDQTKVFETVGELDMLVIWQDDVGGKLFSATSSFAFLRELGKNMASVLLWYCCSLRAFAFLDVENVG